MGIELQSLPVIERRVKILSYFVSSTDDAQEKVIKVVPADLLSPSTEETPQNRNVDPQTDESRPIQ